MGSTLHWREPPGRAAAFEMVTTFGRGRSAGTGFMAYSQRSGPGVLVLCDPLEAPASGRALARALRADGFTVLVPDLGAGDPHPGPRIEAAADYLVDNWHPRLGIVCMATGADLAVRLAGERDVDALVLYAVEGPARVAAWTPLLNHAPDDSPDGRRAAHERTRDFLRHNLS